MNKIFKENCPIAGREVTVNVTYVSSSNLKYGSHYKKCYKKCSSGECSADCTIFNNAPSVIRQ